MITDAALIAVYAGLMVLVVAATVLVASHGVLRKLKRVYNGISACLLGWLLVTFAYHLADSPGLAAYLDNLVYPFVAFMPVLLLVFVVRFYYGQRALPHKGIFFLSLVPFATSVIAVVPSFSHLLRRGYAVVQITPVHIVDYSWGAWQYVHIAYSYLLLGVSGLLVIRQFRKQSKDYRMPSVFMMGGIGMTCISNLPVFAAPTSKVDITLVGVCMSIVVLYIAMVSSPSVEFLKTAGKALYNNLAMPVFILDRQDWVLDMNRSARELLNVVGLCGNAPALTFQAVTETIFDAGGTVKSELDEDNITHIILSTDDKNVVWRLVRREIFNKKGRLLGSYVAMMDITRLSQIIDDLQYKSEIDPLTGIPNRRAYEKMRGELDIPENLPISFIMGDVNRLKQVNDTLGHKQGDLLLITLARMLADACPESGFVARIGGDEFIMILPRCGGEGAQAVVDAITASLKREKLQFLDASIALGHITKTDPAQSADELLQEADRLMYAQKKYDRRARDGGRRPRDA